MRQRFNLPINERERRQLERLARQYSMTLTEVSMQVRQELLAAFDPAPGEGEPASSLTRRICSGRTTSQGATFRRRTRSAFLRSVGPSGERRWRRWAVPSRHLPLARDGYRRPRQWHCVVPLLGGSLSRSRSPPALCRTCGCAGSGDAAVAFGAASRAPLARCERRCLMRFLRI